MATEESVNSLVWDYLKKTVGDKMAKMFQSKTGVKEAPPKGSPTIKDIVELYEQTSAKKRKLEIANGETPKSKKVRGTPNL